jgi:hypothetical protein
MRQLELPSARQIQARVLALYFEPLQLDRSFGVRHTHERQNNG